MANLFRTIYWKYCCILCSPPSKKKFSPPKLRNRSRYTQFFTFSTTQIFCDNPFKVLTINVAYFLGNSLYCRTLSHPVSAITGSTKSTGCTTTLGSPMSDIATFTTATPNKLPPFKIGHNLQTFSNLVTKYNHQQLAASTFSVASVGKPRRGVTVRRAMSVRSRGSDKRAKYNKYDHDIVVQVIVNNHI